MREFLESRSFALSILLIVSMVTLLIGAESVRSDGPLPIQRIPAALEINCWDESREWGSNKYVITDAGAVGAFVDVLNQMERTEAHRPLDMMEVDWNVFVAGNRGYICHLEIAPDAMRTSGAGTSTKVYELDCGPLYEQLDEILQLRRAGKLY